jgi:uncharacterized protein
VASGWQLISKTSAKTAATRLTIAATFWPRLIGWQFRGKPAAEEGLLIVPCNSIHTCFVRFSMDVLFLDCGGTILSIRHDLRPWRFAVGPRGSHAVVEVLAGTANAQPGEILRLKRGEQGAPPPKAVEFLLD